MDSQAVDFPSWAERWGLPPGLKLCWWSLTWRPTLSLLLPGGGGLLADTINFSSAPLAFKSNLHRSVLHHQIETLSCFFTCWCNWLVKQPLDLLLCVGFWVEVWLTGGLHLFLWCSLLSHCPYHAHESLSAELNNLPNTFTHELAATSSS